MKKYAFGIDLGGTTVKMGLFETTGELTRKWEIPTRREEGGSKILPDIAGSIAEELENERISPDEVEGIGIDVPGPVLKESIVNKCVNLGWGVLDVAEELRDLTGIVNVKAANDANAATLGEMWKGGGAGHENLVMLTLGTGVGGGVIINGRIVPGNFGSAGEVGHMHINDDEDIACGCGKFGHVEQYVSATGIVRKTREVLSTDDRPSMLRAFETPTSKDVFDCAKAGDTVALDIVDFVGDQLGKTCALIACVVDPEVFVIGGGVSKAGQILIDTIQKHYVNYVFHASESTKFALASLGNDAGMYGAVKLILS